jgi:hypothetical protein
MATPAFPRPPAATRGFTGSLGARARWGKLGAYFLVAIVSAAAPLSIIRIAYAICFSSWLSGFGFALDVWCAFEALFALWTLFRAQRLSRRRLPIAFPPAERAAALGKILDHVSRAAEITQCIDASDGRRAVHSRCTDDCPHTLLRGWMHGAAWETLHLGHAKSWLAWALFSASTGPLWAPAALLCADDGDASRPFSPVRPGR